MSQHVTPALLVSLRAEARALIFSGEPILNTDSDTNDRDNAISDLQSRLFGDKATKHRAMAIDELTRLQRAKVVLLPEDADQMIETDGAGARRGGARLRRRDGPGTRRDDARRRDHPVGQACGSDARRAERRGVMKAAKRTASTERRFYTSARSTLPVNVMARQRRIVDFLQIIALRYPGQPWVRSPRGRYLRGDAHARLHPNAARRQTEKRGALMGQVRKRGGVYWIRFYKNGQRLEESARTDKTKPRASY